MHNRAISQEQLRDELWCRFKTLVKDIAISKQTLRDQIKCKHHYDQMHKKNGYFYASICYLYELYQDAKTWEYRVSYALRDEIKKAHAFLGSQIKASFWNNDDAWLNAIKDVRDRQKKYFTHKMIEAILFISCSCFVDFYTGIFIFLCCAIACSTPAVAPSLLLSATLFSCSMFIFAGLALYQIVETVHAGNTWYATYSFCKDIELLTSVNADPFHPVKAHRR